jgi:hypothetical protein
MIFLLFELGGSEAFAGRLLLRGHALTSLRIYPPNSDRPCLSRRQGSVYQNARFS